MTSKEVRKKIDDGVWSEYFPVDRDIFVVKNITDAGPLNYHMWIDTKSAAIALSRFLNKGKKDPYACCTIERFFSAGNLIRTKRDVNKWFCFDLCNGHAPGHRYVWYFNTRKQAREASKAHKAIKNSHPISKPVCFKYCDFWLVGVNHETL